MEPRHHQAKPADIALLIGITVSLLVFTVTAALGG